MTEAKVPLITVVDRFGRIRTLSSADHLSVIHGLQPDLDLTILALDNLEKSKEEGEEIDPLLIIGLRIGLVAIANGTHSDATKNIIHDEILVPKADQSVALTVGALTSQAFIYIQNELGQ